MMGSSSTFFLSQVRQLNTDAIALLHQGNYVDAQLLFDQAIQIVEKNDAARNHEDMNENNEHVAEDDAYDDIHMEILENEDEVNSVEDYQDQDESRPLIRLRLVAHGSPIAPLLPPPENKTKQDFLRASASCSADAGALSRLFLFHNSFAIVPTPIMTTTTTTTRTRAGGQQPPQDQLLFLNNKNHHDYDSLLLCWTTVLFYNQALCWHLRALSKMGHEEPGGGERDQLEKGEEGFAELMQNALSSYETSLNALGELVYPQEDDDYDEIYEDDLELELKEHPDPEDETMMMFCDDPEEPQQEQQQDAQTTTRRAPTALPARTSQPPPIVVGDDQLLLLELVLLNNCAYIYSSGITGREYQMQAELFIERIKDCVEIALDEKDEDNTDHMMAAVVVAAVIPRQEQRSSSSPVPVSSSQRILNEAACQFFLANTKIYSELLRHHDHGAEKVASVATTTAA